MEEELSQIVRNVLAGISLPESHLRFSRLCRQQGAHRLFLNVLSNGPPDSDLVFFVGLGLTRIVWAQWQMFSMEEQSSFAGQLLQLISERSADLQPHAQAKLELVLAGVCANAGDLSPVLSLLRAVDVNDTRSIRQANVGISALKTALDEALKLRFRELLQPSLVVRRSGVGPHNSLKPKR